MGFFDRADRRNQEVADRQLHDDPNAAGDPPAFSSGSATTFAFGLVVSGVLYAIASRVTSPDIALGALILFVVVAGAVGIIRAAKNKP